MIAAPQLSPLQSRAYSVLAAGLRAPPPLDVPLSVYASLRMVDALIELEEAFGIGIDVDEAMATHDVASFLALVEARIVAADPASAKAPGCTVYGLTGYREAVGRPLTAHGLQRCLDQHPPENDPPAPAPVETAPQVQAPEPAQPATLDLDIPDAPEPDPAPNPSPAPSHPPAERELVDAKAFRAIVCGLILVIGLGLLAGYR